MPGKAGTLENIAQQVALAFQPLESQLTAGSIIPFLAQVGGLQFPPQLLTPGFTNALNSGAAAAGALPATIAQLAADVASDNVLGIAQDGVKLLQEIGAVINALNLLGTQLGSLATSLPGMNPAEVSAFAAALPENLISYLLISRVESIAYGAAGVANALGVISYVPSGGGGDGIHPPFLAKKLQLGNLTKLLGSPGGLFESLYQFGSPGFDGTALIPVLTTSLRLLGLDAAMATPNSLASSSLTMQANPGTFPPGISVALSDTLPSGIDATLPLSALWSVQLQMQGALAAGLQGAITPPVGIALRPPSGTLNGLLQMNLIAQAPDTAHSLILVGATGGSFVGANSFTFGAGATITWNSSSGTAAAAPQVQLNVNRGTVFIDMSQADGFLSDIIGATPIQANFDLAATWQPDTGLHIRGGAQFEVNLPLHLNLGPVTVETVYLVAGPSSTGIPMEVSVALGLTLGPIQVSVDRVGATTALSFPNSGGNFGPIDLQPIAFKPPNGLGLALDMGLATGGGYITFDPAKGEYAGVLQVSLVDVIQVVVIGVLDTKLPDGSKGFSFLLIITFNFPPIQLGFGFTLIGVGGLGGVNRTMSVGALQGGFRAHTLDAVLSPPDPIHNAPQIISDIRNFFPVAEGRYLFGPLLTLGWGVPTLVSLSLAVLLEVPDPVRIVILGLIDAGLPTEDLALLELHIEVLGVIDFGAQTLAIDGTLYDSSLLIYSLSGDLTLRLAWGANPNFVFSLGGFNPHFNTDGLNVPAKMKRMSVSIGDGDNPRISANSYFAITSNSVQFGANVQAYAEAGGFSISGYLGYDLLVILSPFSFEFDFSAGFDVAFHGDTLAGLTVNGSLSGPTPFHLHGDATIKLLFISVSASVDLHWGSSTQAIIPKRPVLKDLGDALQNPANWSAALPPATGPVVTLTTPTPGGTDLIVHPMGTLTVKEKVVPLDFPITKYGNATASDGTEFSISSVQIDGQAETIQSVPDFFAPGQFLTLSDADKLASPSFEAYHAGVIIGSSAIATGQDRALTVSYNERYIDDAFSLSRFSRLYQMPADIHMALVNRGAGFASLVKNTGLAKYQTPDSETPIALATVQYVVTSVNDLSIRSDIVTGSGSTHYQARAALATYLSANPGEFADLQVMPLHEVTP